MSDIIFNAEDVKKQTAITDLLSKWGDTERMQKTAEKRLGDEKSQLWEKLPGKEIVRMPIGNDFWHWFATECEKSGKHCAIATGEGGKFLKFFIEDQASGTRVVIERGDTASADRHRGAKDSDKRIIIQ